MPINILMPALSPTMEKGNLAKWLKKEGDKVKSGDVIAEIETDKATMEVEAVDEGTLAKIVVPEGTADVPVNQVIAVLAGEGEDVKAAAAGAGEGAGACAEAAAEARRSASRAAAPKPQAAQPAPAAAPPQPPAASAAADGQAATASSPRRWRGGSPRKPASTSPASRAPARTAASSRATSRPRSPARACAAAPAAAAAGCAAVAPSDVGRADPRAVRGRQLRGRAARRHAPHHRAAADAVDADHPAFLSDDRLQHRQAPGRARGDQRRRAEGQGRQAGLQALGQRLRHQGAGAGAAAHARRQRELDRRRHAQAQAFRRRRRGGDAGRPDHADRPPGRDEVALDHLQRDEGLRRARPRPQAQAGGIPGRHHARCPTSACTASRISPR